MILQGIVALVTGGGSGIGEASARALAGEGATVVLTDVDVAKGEAVAHAIEQAGGKAAFIRNDATQESDVQALIADIVLRFGRLDVAHNNVGLGRTGATITSLDMEEWDWTLNLSLKSTWLSMKYEIPAMLAAGGGAIVNTASMAGIFYASSASPAYSAAKAGVIHLTTYAAHAYSGQGIRVNSISPGLVATPLVTSMMTEEQIVAIAGGAQLIERAVKPSEIADAVVYLLSDRSAMVTGTNLEVCGGRK